MPLTKDLIYYKLYWHDKNKSKNEAITEIYKILRPGEPPTIEIANTIFQNLYFSVRIDMIFQMSVE